MNRLLARLLLIVLLLKPAGLFGKGMVRPV